MIEINIEIYVYALFLLITSSVSSFIIIIYSLSNREIKIPSLKAFQLYFLIGAIGWIFLAIQDSSSKPNVLTIQVVLAYIICSFILFIAITESKLKSRFTLTIAIIYLIFLIISFLVPTDSYKILVISVMTLVLNPYLIYISLKRGIQGHNIGYHVIAFANFLFSFGSVIQIYGIVISNDYIFSYGVSVIMSSTGYVLLGIGLLTSILVNEHKKLAQLALRDPLTGLLNRRGLDYTSSVLLSTATRNNLCVSAIAIDIDHFKKVNDEFGHDIGDLALQLLAKTLLECPRANDVCGRLGGEEFIILLADTELSDALNTAERIRKLVEEKNINTEKNSFKLTISLGVASHCGTVNLDDLLKDADKALYLAKEKGRNQVCHAAQA